MAEASIGNPMHSGLMISTGVNRQREKGAGRFGTAAASRSFGPPA